MTSLDWLILQNVRAGRPYDADLPKARPQHVVTLQGVGWVTYAAAHSHVVHVITRKGEEMLAKVRHLEPYLKTGAPLPCVARDPVDPLTKVFPQERCGRPSTPQSSVLWPLCGLCRSLAAQVELRYRGGVGAVRPPAFKYE